MTTEIKPLPEHLHRRGVYYDLVKRTGNVAIYSLRYSQGKRIVGFDVFRVLVRKGGAFRGKILPPYEQFPIDSAYGQTAWSFDTEKTANRKFDQLVGAVK